jgi:hypothetical protein
MPQFDVYSWLSVAFWVVFSFQLCYFLLLRYFIVNVSEFQKFLQKLGALFSHVVSFCPKDLLILKQIRR